MSELSSINMEGSAVESKAASWLGVAGLAPFIAAAVYLTAAAFEMASTAGVENATVAIELYGAIILSFLGGVRWGVSMQAGERRASHYVMAVVPALAAWAVALLSPVMALLGLALCLQIHGMMDTRTASSGRLPEWYGVLRIRLTTVAVASQLVSAGSLLLLMR